MGDFVLDALTRNGPVMKTLSLPRGRHRLHAMPTNFGYDRVTSQSYDWSGRKRGETPFTVLQHTLSGRGHLTYDRRLHRIEAGDTMLVMIPHDHRYWLAEGDHWEFFWISMYGQEALRLQKTILDVRGPVFRLSEEAIGLLAASCHGLLERAGQDLPERPGTASSLAYQALMALYDDLLAPHSDSAGGEDAGTLDAIRGYVREHLDQPLDVEALARLAGFSRAHFTRIFTAAEGIPPAEYVLNERMRRAARLLESGDLPVKAISIACGFSDPNYFAKAFRRTFGTSPTEFRTTGMYAVNRALDESFRASEPARS
ncbi:transcriptional regulator, AraC family [Faunimonas pinastri]|uniref:Transcriptional regulator, AraC family n=1 Tax=Faunimonas pinastri TaxID=1855383 RepID=A0A1H9K4T3_9HYPH|nr:AraC family transcriptional regulator [Faunimonas pinastri]SEQ94112.1 transcriptional regulator, AraC family [Faunimonas pinastri]